MLFYHAQSAELKWIFCQCRNWYQGSAPGALGVNHGDFLSRHRKTVT